MVKEENGKEIHRSHTILFTYMDKKLVEVLSAKSKKDYK
jgi:hypothetical protein